MAAVTYAGAGFVLARGYATPPRLDAAVTSHTAVLARAIGCEPLPGNAVDVLIDGPATHAAMFEAIAAARDHVNIESYIVDHVGPGQELSELLLRKRAEGVRVNLMFDGWGSWKTSSRYFEILRAAGVEVVEFNPSIHCGIRSLGRCICAITASSW